MSASVKAPRAFPVKSLLSADEYLDFKGEAEKADEPQSRVIRNLVLAWTGSQKNKRGGGGGAPTWPCPAHNRAMFMPGRMPNYGTAHMRMRQ